jgi:uncharacterized coiled-coil DUF342 family protein
MNDAYTITFPMVMAGILTIGGTILAFFVKKWLADADKASDKKDEATHEGFQTLHGRIDKLRDAREMDLEKVHSLELDLAGAIKREEMTELYHHIDSSKDEIIKALAHRPGA